MVICMCLLQFFFTELQQTRVGLLPPAVCVKFPSGTSWLGPDLRCRRLAVIGIAARLGLTSAGWKFADIHQSICKVPPLGLLRSSLRSTRCIEVS